MAMKLSDSAGDIEEAQRVREVNAKNPVFQALIQHKDPMSEAIALALYGTSIYTYSDEFRMVDKVRFGSGRELAIQFRLADGFADRVDFWLRELQKQVGTVGGEIRQQESFAECEAGGAVETWEDEDG